MDYANEHSLAARGGMRWMARRKEDDLDPAPVGRRLYLTRKALDLTQKKFASRAGIATNTYGQYEKGSRLISPKAAVDLCEQYSLTLDWIYRGEPGNLPYTLGDAIKAMSELAGKA